MRHKLSVLLALFITMPAYILADGYNTLWKQAELAKSKDLPREEIAIMTKIIHKAEADNDYGQLLAARFRSMTLWESISPDSLSPQLSRLEQMAVSAESSNPALAAVYYAALAKTYKAANTLDNGDSLGKQYAQKAMSDPASLAKHQTADYEPLVKEGVDGHIFQHDLLHVIGFETEAYKAMHDYYVKNGNRKAACITACYMTRQERKQGTTAINKSKYLAQVDSLMHEYRDLQEAGELAIEHYTVISEAEDVKVEEEINFINYALNRWGKWPRMNILRNAKSELLNPSFSSVVIKKVFRPNEEIKVVMNRVRNIRELTMTISRLNITADNNYDPNKKEDYAKLRKMVTSYRQVSKSLRFLGQPEYKVLKDSFQVSPLSPGAYLIEIESNDKDVAVSRDIFYVSDMAVIKQHLPGNLTRFVAVSATTGQPVAGAKIMLGSKTYNQDKMQEKVTLTADKNGEATFTYDPQKNDTRYVYAYTDKDKFAPPTWLSGNFNYSEDKQTVTKEKLFTDRSIYRPGQTVHVALLRYEQSDGINTKALEEANVTLRLYDANRKEVATKEVKTDTYGTATADFVLPQNGLTGSFFVRSDLRNSCSFNVEEYKRPTFEITFPEVNHRYQSGDTVVVKASAKTYTGMPVSKAKVKYTVTRRPSMWCWWGMSESGIEEVYRDTLETDEEGQFAVEIPLTIPVGNTSGIQPRKGIGRFFSFDVTADVTDLSGESHRGEMSLPLGTRATAFTTDMAERIEKDSLHQYTFIYKNAAGDEIAAKVRYRIDNGAEQLASTNVAIKPTADFYALESGKHTLTAICENDTLRHDFFLFTMQDTRPVSKVSEWFYQTTTEFHKDNTPVYVQVGSSDNNVHVVYSIICGNTVLEQGTMELANSIATRSFTYDEKYGSGLSLNYAWVKDGVFHNYQTTIQRPMPDKRLQVEWKTFRDRLTPGQKEEWTLRITKPNGTPARAQLMSVLYDKSLDQLKAHDWNFALYLYSNLPYTQWKSNIEQIGSFYLGSQSDYKTYKVRNFDFDTFNPDFFLYQSYQQVMVRGTRALFAPAAMMSTTGSVVLQESVALDNAGNADIAYKKNEAKGEEETSGESGVQLRENLSETAFFFPSLESDGKGEVRLRFTLPESVTTWKMMGVAHDKDMNYGTIADEVVARKQLMIQPNMPRFLRQGDNGQLVCRISNTGEKDVTGTARMELIDPETMKVVYAQNQKYALKAGAVSAVNFDITAKELPSLTICKVTASGKDYSDGEQHYLPILSNIERVINTLPFVCNQKGKVELDLQGLVPDSIAQEQVNYTLEYTHNPAWLMIQALPTVSMPNDDNAISLSTAFYANAIANHLLRQAPHLKTVLELWKRESGNENTLMSSLAKNEELRQLVLKETPWVLDADKETEQRQLLINYLDSSQVNNRLETQYEKLANLQREDGSFSWWKEMPGSRYMTTAVAETLVRLNKMTGKQAKTQQLLKKAIAYLAKEAHEEVTRLKTMKKEGELNPTPSESALDYLYIIGIDGTKLNASQQEDKDYLMSLVSARPTVFTIYGKARYAVILGLGGNKTKAKEYLQSLKEYSVFREDMGRYFDTSIAYYSWKDYKIPTEVAAIEALRLVTPEDTQTIDEMRQWLLRSKQTQAWDTPINTVNAAYAFLDGNMEQLTTEQPKDALLVNGKQIELPKATAAIGYVKTSLSGKPKQLAIDRKTDAISWGAVHATFNQPATQVKATASGIQVSREVIGDAQHVGDKVKVRVTVIADRDYDFVAVVDKRAACLEPVRALSEYQRGYYITPRDNATYYYFNTLSKGKHVIETEYYIDRMGTYTQGTCYAECAYSPEFRGSAPSSIITIK